MSVDLASDRMRDALRARGVTIRQVRFRENRTVLLSLSRDGRTLNSHACFRRAPARILDAVAVFLRSRRGSPEQRLALETIRRWRGARAGVERARRARPRRLRPRPAEAPHPATPALEALYARLNRQRFGGRLPVIPLRVSRRMTRSLGTISYAGRGDSRRVKEIAIAADLLRAANRRVLEDTLLHEMAHAEAWLVHDHRGHGPIWRAIAERVGCTPRALIQLSVRGRHYV